MDKFRNRTYRSSQLIENISVGSAPRLGRVLCLFAHFDDGGVLQPCDVHHLESVRRDLACDIAFCSTHLNLDNPQNAETLRRLTFLSVVRANKGYDFGSWKTLLDLLASELANYEHILFINNSVFGPIFPLTSLNEISTAHPDAVLGITESDEREHHLQSYFLFVPRPVFTSAAFRGFWNNFRFLDYKNNIVYAYEMGLTRMFRRAGFQVRALFPTTGLVLGNPTHRHWLKLVQEQRCPYVKRDIVKRGSATRKDVEELRRWVGSHTQFDPHTIGL